MKQLLLFIISLCLVCSAMAQTKKVRAAHFQTAVSNVPVTEHAVFNSMGAFIIDNLRYPEDAWDNGIQGKLLVRFLVDEKGMVHDPEVIRDPMGCQSCEAEAKRVIGAMPPWKPAMYKNRPVAEVKVLPVEFRIDR